MADTADPFPLFHLANLDFRCTSSSLNELPTYQLALAPWSAEWDDSLETALKRGFRRRREKVRAQIAAKAHMGIYSSSQDLQKEQFPNYELIDLSFDLSNLEELSSAQLAAVVFHPSSTKDLVMDAEDIFFRRRERDFAAGLSLPTDMTTLSPSTSSQTSSHPAPAPSQTTSSRLPSSVSRDSTSAPARPPPPPAPPVAAPSSSSARPPSNFEGDISPMPFSLPGMRPSTYTSTSNASPSRAPPSMVDSHSRYGPDEPEKRRLSMAEYRERQQEKERTEEKDRHLQREAELRRNLEREMERNRSRDRERIPSGPSIREPNARPGPPPTASTRDYRDERRSPPPPPQRKRERSPPRNVDLRESTRRRTDDYPPPPPSRSNEPFRDTRPPARDINHERSRDSRLDDRVRLDDRIREPRRRTPSPPRRAPVQTSQPVIPRPSPEDWIPPKLQETLSTVFIRFFPPQSKEQIVLDFLNAVVPNVTRPIAIKFGVQRKSKRVASGESRDGWLFAFAAFERREDAIKVKEKADKARWNGEEHICSWASETNQSVWKWSAFPADFVENWYQSEVARVKDSRSSTNSGAAAPVNAPSGPRSLSSRIAPLPSAAPPPSASSRTPVNAPRERRMSNSSTTNSVAGTAASTATGITTSVQRLPRHLKDLLWEMFVDNLPRDVNVRSCRDFFDVCDGIVGLAIPPQGHSGSTSHCWLAFATKTDRARSMDRLRGSKFPGASMKLWMEHGEERKAKGLPSTYDWLWSEMSKEYRNSRLEDYQRSTMRQESPAPRPAQSRPEYYANLPPEPLNSTTQAIGYSPFQPVISFPPPAAPPLQQQQQSTNPNDPFYASYGSPWRPTEFTSTARNDTQHSAEVAAPTKAGIHPSRLAILAQTGIMEEPVTRGPDTSQDIDTGSNVVQEKRMIEETTKNAYGARKRRAESDASSTNMQQDYTSSGNESVIVAIRGVAQSPPILPRVSASPMPQAMNGDVSMDTQSASHDMPGQSGGGGADSFLATLNLPPNASLPNTNDIMNPSETSTMSSSTVIADSEEQSKELATEPMQDDDNSASVETKMDVGGDVEENMQMESQEDGNKEEPDKAA